MIDKRRQELLELINSRGFATLSELVTTLGVSESTVRRDLEALDQAGLARRTHGGAFCSAELRTMPALEDRAGSMAAEKRLIGRAAAGLVADGESVLLDGGTTTLEVARALCGRPLQVVTNSLPIAAMVAAYPGTDLVLIGGYVYPRTGVAMGPLAISALLSLRVRYVFLGAAGIMPDGIYNSNTILVDTQRQMMAVAQDVVVVADQTKFGKLSLSRLCGLNEIGRLVTDSNLVNDHKQMLRRSGVELVLAAGLSANEMTGLMTNRGTL
ncbi:MAG: DeoR/GlpR family DNA-binding transcription regulator [Planctomycetota bacterium]